MNREQAIKKLKHQSEPWDIIVIGGGATGLGIAVVTTSRGVMTAKSARNENVGGEVLCEVW